MLLFISLSVTIEFSLKDFFFFFWFLYIGQFCINLSFIAFCFVLFRSLFNYNLELALFLLMNKSF